MISALASNPYVGSLGRLFAQGKTLELAAMTLSAILHRDAPGGRGLNRRDEQRMNDARDTLDTSMAREPTLAELGRTLGISTAKLKRDFKAVHGMNVHEYAVNRRLDTAARILSQDGGSVKEVSWAVGYRSAEHFARAFRRRFGVTPGAFARRR